MSVNLATRSVKKISSEMSNLLAQIGQCRTKQIKSSAKLREDLGIDSFTAMEIIVAIEKRYGIKILEEEVNHLITFNDLVRFLMRKLGSKSH